MDLDRLVNATLDAVNEFGFCVIPNVLPPDRTAALRCVVDEVRERESPQAVGRVNVNDHASRADGHQRVLHLVEKHPAFVDLMCHPLAMAIYSRYLGSDFVCSTWTCNTALPGADLTYWHVDHPYWTIAPPYPVEPPLTAHAIWCLDDFSERNGATKVVPGSHRRTHLPEDNGNYDPEGVTIEAPTGSLIVAHGAIWHSAGCNTTTQPRTAVFGRFARSFMVLQEDMKRQLQAIPSPTPLVERLLGKNQYVPRPGLPY